jgi:hypothetical protein
VTDLIKRFSKKFYPLGIPLYEKLKDPIGKKIGSFLFEQSLTLLKMNSDGISGKFAFLAFLWNLDSSCHVDSITYFPDYPDGQVDEKETVLGIEI